MYKVYKHTSPNGKVYIGITGRKVEERWRDGNGYAHSPHFNAAIKKYGWDKINHEILFSELTKKEAEEKEISLIKEYQSTNPLYGYNCDSGGNANHTHTEETKNKIRLSHIGMTHGEETRKKISALKKGNKNRLGQKQSDECKRKISEKNKGKWAGTNNYFHTHIYCGEQHWHSKAIEKYDFNGNLLATKLCAEDFARELNKKNATHIIEVCRGKRKSAYGFLWKYKGGQSENGMV